MPSAVHAVDPLEMQALVSAAKAGSHAAFERLQALYASRLFRQIYAITRHYEDAEDALQDALCQAYLALPRFEERSSLYSWISRIAINSALMKLRKHRRSHEVVLQWQKETDEDTIALEFPDHRLNPEEFYEDKERDAQLARAMEQLDRRSQEVLYLQIEQGCSMKEIAARLAMSKCAVKAQLHRARKKLRAIQTDSKICKDPGSHHPIAA
jgi:RNA polymerase sigma-70 factor, ECF subfamily